MVFRISITEERSFNDILLRSGTNRYHGFRATKWIETEVCAICPIEQTEMHPQLKPFVQVIHGLAAILGEDCEVILHDVTRLERSIVACANGHITGRPLGSPMSAYGLELLNTKKFANEHSTYTYMARANSGTLIRCGVLALRDAEGEIIGLICIHFDASKAQAARELLESFFAVGGGVTREEPVNEFFGLELEDVFNNTMQEIRHNADKPLKKLSKVHKKEVIRTLIDRGFFMMKGAVEHVAREMGNSKFTIYAYMREIEREDGSVERNGVRKKDPVNF